MKKKFICLLLVFTVFFSSVNFSFANDDIEPLFLDGGIISAPMLATVVTLAVGTGIAIKNIDDIYDVGRLFYDYVKSNNEIMWDTVVSVFNSSVAFDSVLKKVIVGNSFGDIVKDFFDNTFIDSNIQDGSIGNNYNSINFPYLEFTPKSIVDYLKSNDLTYERFKFSSWEIEIKYSNYGVYFIAYFPLVSGNNGNVTLNTSSLSSTDNWRMFIDSIGVRSQKGTGTLYLHYRISEIKDLIFSSVSIPYNPGSYNPGNVWNPGNTDDVGIYVPGNLGDIVGDIVPGDIVGDIAPPWVGDGSVTVPGFDNPSIDVGGDITFPGVGTIPGELCPECGATVGTHNPGCSLDKPINPPGDLFPPWGGGIDFSPVTGGKFTEKFPFSLASDIGNILDTFNVPPKAPIFKVPIVSEELTVDLTEFTVWANIVRYFVLLGFVICLINITRKVIG